MIIKIRKKSIYKTIFSIWFITGILTRTTIGRTIGVSLDWIDDTIDTAVAIALVAFILFLQEYSFKEMATLGAIGGLVLLTGVKSGNFLLVPTFLFIVAAKNVDLDEMIALAHVLLIICFIVVLLCYITGNANDYLLRRGSHVRYSLGFSHPNILGLRVFQLIVFRFYSKGNQLSLLDLVIGVFASIFTYIVPNSQTAFICITVYVISVFFRKVIFDTTGKAIALERLLLFFSVFFNVASVFISFLDQNIKAVRQINSVLSLRFYYCNYVLKRYGIGLFGNKLYISGTGELMQGSRVIRLYLDNAYMGMMLWYGVLIYLLFYITYVKLMSKSYKEGNYRLFMVMFIFSVYGVMELGMYIIAQNIFLIAFNTLLFSKENSESKEEKSTLSSEISSDGIG